MKNYRIVALCLSLALFVGAIFPTGVSAAKWVTVAENESRKIEVDDDSLMLIDGKNRVQCFTRTTSQGVTGMSTIRVDIPSIAFAVGLTKLYNESGEMISSTPGDLTEYQPILPNSLGMQLFYFVQAYHDVMVYPKPTR